MILGNALGKISAYKNIALDHLLITLGEKRTTILALSFTPFL